MLIQYTATGHRRDVPDSIGQQLVNRRLARKVVEAEEEISPRTGKPKRKYTRRDMRAED